MNFDPPPACVGDYRELARRKLPRMLFDYVDGGSYSETTLARNVEDFQNIALRQRVMKDVGTLSTATELFGQPLSMPLLLGPVGMGGLYAKRGETLAAQAAQAAGINLCLSTLSICSLEEVSKGVDKPIWYQLYMIRDRGYMRALLQRATEAKVPVLAFTVDLQVPGTRYRDVRSGLTGAQTLPMKLRRAWQGLSHPAWMDEVFFGGRPHTFGNLIDAIPGAKGSNDYWAWIGANFDPRITWDDLAWVREHWAGPIVIKGILDVEDARMAAAAGADGIVVSNHGGRQLDGAMSSIRALPGIVEAVGDRLPVLMDGGVRSGLDVLKALALGARACLIGRAWAYALAGGGKQGVAHIIEIMRGELLTAMALTGCTDVREAGRVLLADDPRR